MVTAKVLRHFGTVEWLIAALCLASLSDFAYRWSHLLGVFWDISVYERAVADYGHGVDAYRTDMLFPFVYHPLVLRTLAVINSIVPLRVLLPALTVASFVWLFLELMQMTREVTRGLSTTGSGEAHGVGPRRLLLAALAAAAFGGIGAAALMSGNMAPLMHFSVMAALLHGGRTSGVSRYLPCALIGLFALVKPYFLIFLAVPVLLYERRTVNLACAALVVAFFAVVWQSFGPYMWPAEYAHFLSNLRWHILGRSDLGYTFFYFFGAITHNVFLALVLHALVSLALVALIPLLFTRKYGHAASFAPRLLVLYLVLTMANPRMKDYDLFPALVGFFAVFGLLLEWAAPVTLAALSLAAVPLLSAVFPDLSAHHPVLFDPFGNWQLVSLAVMGLLFLVEMLDERALEKSAPASKPL
jgi:hypothetical protein